MTGWWNNLINQGRTLLIALAIMLACLGGALFLVTNASYFLVDGRLMGVSQRIVEHDYLRILGYLQLPWSGETMRLDYLPTDAKVLRGWLQWLLVGFLVAVILIGLNFEPVFLWFHYHAFSNQDWLFDPKKEPLINLWPTSFFMTLAISWGLLVEGLIYLIYRWVKKELHRFVFLETGLEETNDGRD